MLSLSVKAHAQMAHLVFSETQANAQKTKRAIFCQRTFKTKKFGTFKIFTTFAI